MAALKSTDAAITLIRANKPIGNFTDLSAWIDKLQAALPPGARAYFDDLINSGKTHDEAVTLTKQEYLPSRGGASGPSGDRGLYDADGLKGQMQPYSCVAAACSMVGGWPEAYWRTAADTAIDGTQLSDAARALNDQGIPSIYRTDLSISDLAAATIRPSIVAGNGHAVVVDGVSGGRVFIRDPWPVGEGSAYTVSISDFSEWWSGRAVIPNG